MWILGADADDEGVEQSIEAVDERIENHGGERVRSAAWGRRSLAYPINHNTEGVYNVVQFTMEPNESVIFEREILADQGIIRHLQLRIEESDLLPETPVLPPSPSSSEEQSATAESEDPQEEKHPEVEEGEKEAIETEAAEA